jgi:hypothetical protein
MDSFEKQPGEDQDYNANFTDYVLSQGEAVDDAHTIEDVTVSGPDDELVIQSSTIHNGVSLKGISSTFIKVWTTGGTARKTYKITAIIATAGGRIHEHEFQIKVKER